MFMSAERYARIREMLALRQPDLTVCLEEVHKPHNVAAIVRTCDAVGVHQIHGVWNDKNSMRKGTSMGSQIWVKNNRHDSIGSAVKHLKNAGMQVLVTNLSQSAVDFRSVDYTLPTAIILGQEKDGATQQAIELADTDIVIPMAGMVQSLNVSVAGALVLYEAQRQRSLAGMYDCTRLSESECQRVLFEGGFPQLCEICIRKKLPYPQINELGGIEADEQWWQQMQLSSKAYKKSNVEIL